MVATSSLWAADERPNIILFLVDDMGWQETSVPFYSEETPLNRRFHTPNMEKLAEKGVKFMQAYSCAISSPSRCSLMSGMNAARHRVTNWTLNYNSNNDAGGGSITLPDWNYNGIQPAGTSINNATSITSLPQILHDNGYYTIHCGKAHFGAKNTDGEDPLNFGFDVNIAGGANGGPASYLGSDNYCTTGSDFCINGLDEYAAQGMFLTEALTQEACRVLGEHLDSQSNQPFYLYMAHYAIHAPYNADSRFTSRYTGVFDEQLGQTLNSTEVNIAALVEGMDKSLGDIMTFLDDRAIAENTIILFMSDNGGQAVAPRQGRHNRDQNYPARGGKGSSYMGGVHEPMMVYWPGITVGGTENHNPVMIEDFFPTILEIAGVTDYETVQTVDGHSFVDIIKNPNIQRDRTTIWHFPNRWGESQDKNEGYGAYSAILKGDYHMIYFWENQERRLYNIKEDVGEQNNLADQSAYAQTLTELSEELTDSLIAFDAQRPTQNGEYVPWPKDAVYVETVEIGDPVTITDAIFKFSNENNKYYYSIQDNRGSDMAGPYYWTLGSHNGYKAIQVTNENKTTGEEKGTQLFYFMPGTGENMFKIYTYDGQMVDYLDGLTLDSWNNGNTTTTTETHKYLQYGTSTSGEFQLVTSESEGYYGIAYSDGTLMNNRGTANGSAVNMNWVINTYNNNSTTDSGSRYKFTLVEPRRTVTVESNNAEYGSVTIEGETGTSVELPIAQTIVIKATATDGYMFYRWIEKDSENVVSYRPTYTYTIAEDKTLVAEFVEKDYPIMTRFYEVGLDQQNRYLGEASYMVGDETHELFVCENETDLPFTAYTQLHTTQMEGAVINKTSTPIQLNEGVESFTLKVKQYNNNITYGTYTCEPELVWTRQTLFIDWNNDKEFAGTDEVYATMGNGDSDNNFGDTNGSVENGWQRTINVPAGTEAGTYRMRVVYMAPNPYTEDWPSKVFTDFFGELRNGIAYDFEIQIAQASAIDAVTESAIYYDAQAQLLVAPRMSEVTVYNLAGQLVLDAQGTEISVASLAQGVYIAKVGNQVIKFVK